MCRAESKFRTERAAAEGVGFNGHFGRRAAGTLSQCPEHPHVRPIGPRVIAVHFPVGPRVGVRYLVVVAPHRFLSDKNCLRRAILDRLEIDLGKFPNRGRVCRLVNLATFGKDARPDDLFFVGPWC